MSKKTALIIDDERLAREELKLMLSSYDTIEIIGEAKNGNEALELIQSLQPDVLFLDINMPGLTGIDLVKKLDVVPYVIFVTAYDNHAAEAFELNALDYLLKPIDPDRLKQSIQRLSVILEEELESPIKQPEAKSVLTVKDSIYVKDGENCYFIHLSNIIYFESVGNYIKINIEGKKPMILKSLSALEDRLNPYDFFRTNRKHIVNLKKIQKVENWFNGGLMFEMENGEKIEVSRRQAVRFKDQFTL